MGGIFRASLRAARRSQAPPQPPRPLPQYPPPSAPSSILYLLPSVPFSPTLPLPIRATPPHPETLHTQPHTLQSAFSPAAPQSSWENRTQSAQHLASSHTPRNWQLTTRNSQPATHDTT